VSGVDFSRLRSLSARHLASALRTDGFILKRQKGSHRHYVHPDGRRVTLSFHHASDRFGQARSEASSNCKRVGMTKTSVASDCLPDTEPLIPTLLAQALPLSIERLIERHTAKIPKLEWQGCRLQR
jgi:predicted RNA binding protein YcfA (HicA-like mRNA interferase family)